MAKSREPDSLPKSILVAYDGSPGSKAAARFALALARATQARLSFVTVLLVPANLSESTVSALVGDLTRKSASALEELDVVANQSGVSFTKQSITTGVSVVRAIIEFAESMDSDLIVMGTKGVTGYSKMMLGSVAAGVLAGASSSVLVVR